MEKIEAALTALHDAICSYERDTGIQFVLILRADDGFCRRSISGKPIAEIQDYFSDDFYLQLVQRKDSLVPECA